MHRERGQAQESQKYKTPDEMQSVIDEYFEANDKPSVTGLALSLGFLSRQAVINYEGYSQEFHDTLKKAKLKVEASYEADLRKPACSGSIFALKNFNWTDRQEITGRDGTPLPAPTIIVQPPKEG